MNFGYFPLKFLQIIHRIWIVNIKCIKYVHIYQVYSHMTSIHSQIMGALHPDLTEVYQTKMFIFFHKNIEAPSSWLCIRSECMLSYRNIQHTVKQYQLIRHNINCSMKWHVISVFWNLIPLVSKHSYNEWWYTKMFKLK